MLPQDSTVSQQPEWIYDLGANKQGYNLRYIEGERL